MLELYFYTVIIGVAYYFLVDEGPMKYTLTAGVKQIIT